MQKNERIVRFTTDELIAKRQRGESRTNWAHLDAMSEAELEDAIDRDDEGEFDWSTVRIGLPGPKQQLTVRFDRDVIEWFRAQGAGYQTRMNAVLRGYMEATKQK